MPLPVLLFLGAFGLIVVYFVIQTRKAGPRQITETDLSRATVVASATADAPGHGWARLGSRTTADGLRLKFDADDDPEAEAVFLADPRDEKRSATMSHTMTIVLGSDFETHHVHTRGYVFRVRLRGTGSVVGKEVRLQMRVRSNGTPLGGKVENDDDTDAAVGDWIEFERAEILRVRP